MSQALTYDPAASLRHYPVSLARFGQNQYSENLYRIVFAPTRRHLVCGQWPDGSDRAAYVRKHGGIGDVWIMERWLSAFEFTGMTAERWSREMLILGPYPDRGEYELCHVFDGIAIDDVSIEKLVAMIEEGRKRSFSEKRAWHREDSDRERKEIGNTQEAMIRNSLPAFGSAPMIGYGGKRGSKTAPILRTAAELGLPTSGGKVRTRDPRGPLGGSKRPEYEIPLKVA